MAQSTSDDELVALATFVFNTVGCDLYEYVIEPYSSLISHCVAEDTSVPIGEALVRAFRDQEASDAQQ